AAAVDAAVDLALGAVGNPGGQEVVLDHGNPAAVFGQTQVGFLHVLEAQLVVGLLAVPVGRAQVCRHGREAAGGLARVVAAVTLDLAVQRTLPGAAAIVADDVRLTNQVAATLEGEALDDIHPVGLAQGQVDVQFVLAVEQLVFALFGLPGGATFGAVGAVGANNATLCHIGPG